MVLNTVELVTLIVAVPALTMALGYLMRHWTAADMKELVHHVLDERARRHPPSKTENEIFNATISLERKILEVKEPLEQRIAKLETNDQIRQTGISALKEEITKLDERVTELERLRDSLEGVAHFLAPKLEHSTTEP